MEGKTTSQTKARFIVLAVFVIGFVAGALAMNLYVRKSADPGGASPRGSRNGGPPQDHIMKRMTDRLGLDSDQQGRIRAILGDTFHQYQQIREKADPEIDAVRVKGREKIREVLKPEQLSKFEDMVREMDKKREDYKEREKEKEKRK